MNGWTILMWAGICSAGMLLFLGAVALDIRRAEIDLRNFESEKRKSYDRRLEADIHVAEVCSEADAETPTVPAKEG